MKKELQYNELSNEGKLSYRREKRDLVNAYTNGKKKPNAFSKNVRRIELEAYDEFTTTLHLENDV